MFVVVLVVVVSGKGDESGGRRYTVNLLFRRSDLRRSSLWQPSGARGYGGQWWWQCQGHCTER